MPHKPMNPSTSDNVVKNSDNTQMLKEIKGISRGHPAKRVPHEHIRIERASIPQDDSFEEQSEGPPEKTHRDRESSHSFRMNFEHQVARKRAFPSRTSVGTSLRKKSEAHSTRPLFRWVALSWMSSARTGTGSVSVSIRSAVSPLRHRVRGSLAGPAQALVPVAEVVLARNVETFQ